MDLNERQVRERAYFIWENEGRVFGRAEAHWFQAEAELRHRASAPLRVEAVALDAIQVASPAEVLKPRASRAKAPAKVVLTEVAAPAKPAAKKAAPKAKSGTTKTATAKAPTAKTPAAKAKPRAARADAVGVSLH